MALSNHVVVDSFKPISSTQNAMNITYLSFFFVTYKTGYFTIIDYAHWVGIDRLCGYGVNVKIWQ
jgi:hypothetical protein